MTRWYPFRELDQAPDSRPRHHGTGLATTAAAVGATGSWVFEEGSDEGDLLLAAKLDVPVLVEADAPEIRRTLARLIHDRSTRQARPWLLLPSSTVSYAARGGGSTSLTDWLYQADGGTLCIEDISMLHPRQLEELSSLLETAPAARQDAAAAPRRVRVIAGAPTGLLARVAHGRFPAGLFYRLNVIRIVCAGGTPRRPPV